MTNAKAWNRFPSIPKLDRLFRSFSVKKQCIEHKPFVSQLNQCVYTLGIQIRGGQIKRGSLSCLENFKRGSKLEGYIREIVLYCYNIVFNYGF